MRSDADLVAASRAGDRSAFAALVDRHRTRAVAVATAMLRDPTEAEDLVQDAVLHAFLGLDRLRNPERFGAWLCGITVNVAKMRLRQRRDRVVLDGLGGGRVVGGDLDGVDPSPEQALEAAEQLRLVQEAVRVLAPGQREVVLMYYLEGLSCQEIAALLGRSTGSVRVQLHRARRQLRERLSVLAPPTTPTRPRKELPPMIELTLEDVIVRVLDTNGDGAPQLAEPRQRVVLLKEREGDRVLPIWVGAPEGDALALQLASESMPRPMTSDLLARIVDATGSRVERVTINSLRESTFYATVELRAGDTVHELDARPSDALNLAARVGAPIYAEAEVLAEAAVAEAELGERMKDEEAKVRGDEAQESAGEWQSVSPELVRALHPMPPPRK